MCDDGEILLWLLKSPDATKTVEQLFPDNSLTSTDWFVLIKVCVAASAMYTHSFTSFFSVVSAAAV
jgi:hypothetical protein